VVLCIDHNKDFCVQRQLTEDDFAVLYMFDTIKCDQCGGLARIFQHIVHFLIKAPNLAQR